MGCDIHMYAERLVDDKWELVTGEDTMLPWFKMMAESEKDADRKKYFEGRIKDFSEPSPNCIYGDRNYRLFAILADVRNSYDIDPIDDPRGIPEDCCEWISEEYKGWEMDAHSASYFSLEELEAYSANNKYTVFTDYGWVSQEEYIEFLKNGRPTSWCGDISGGRISKVSNEVMNSICAGTCDEYEDPYTFIEWCVPIEGVGAIKTIIDKMKQYSDGHKIRVVFWFDN